MSAKKATKTKAKTKAQKAKSRAELGLKPYMPDHTGFAHDPNDATDTATEQPIKLPWSERAALMHYFPPGGEKTEEFKRKVVVLECLAKGMTVRMAATLADCGRSTVFMWRNKEDKRYFDPMFLDAWDKAMEAGSEFYEDEVRRRATEGTLKPVYQQGELVGHVREFSDNLLMMATKARLPGKYRENVHTTGEMTVIVSPRDMKHAKNGK